MAFQQGNGQMNIVIKYIYIFKQNQYRYSKEAGGVPTIC
jgi:hypothetical protein